MPALPSAEMPPSLSPRTPTLTRVPVGAMAILLGLLLALVVSGLAPPVYAAASGSLRLQPGEAAAASAPGTYHNARAGATFTVPNLSNGGVGLAVELRAGGRAGYRAKVWVGASGQWSQSLVRVRNGTETTVASRAMPQPLTAGSKIMIQLTTTGTDTVTLAMRAWRSGSTKPDWQVKAKDSSGDRISGSGSARVWGYRARSGSATSVAYGAFDAWTVLAGQNTSSSSLSGSTSTKPSQETTGVPSGTNLTVRRGDITVTKAGTVLSGLDIRGFVTVKAPNVTIRNSIVRGGTATFNRGVITNYGYANLLLENVDIVPSSTTVWQDGVKGSDFTLRKVYITGNVDSVKIHGNGNVLVEKSLLENTTYFSRDPNQGGKPTHNDGVQILSGHDVRIVGNTIRGHRNFAVLGAANLQNTSGLVVKGNWLDGGHCTSKFEEMNGKNLSATVTSNRFGPNRVVDECKIAAQRTVALTASGNVVEGSGDPVQVLWGGN